jgi:hypothetical protein
MATLPARYFAIERKQSFVCVVQPQRLVSQFGATAREFAERDCLRMNLVGPISDSQCTGRCERVCDCTRSAPLIHARTLTWKVLRHASSTVALNGAIYDAQRGSGHSELGERETMARCATAAAIARSSGEQHEQSRLLDVDARRGNVGAHCRLLGEQFAKRHARHGAVDVVVETARRHANGTHAVYVSRIQSR